MVGATGAVIVAVGAGVWLGDEVGVGVIIGPVDVG